MRPREIPLLVSALGVPLWIGIASLPRGETCAEVPGPPPSTAWLLIGGFALLGVAARARAQGQFLLARVGEDRPVPGSETYRDAATYRVLPEAIARDWRRRAAIALGTSAASVAFAWTARAGASMVIVASAIFAGAALFLQHRRGHASLLYLPLIAAALLSLSDRLATSAAVPLFLLLYTAVDAFEAWSRAPLGGYELDSAGLRAASAKARSGAWTAAWLGAELVLVASALPLPAYAYQGYIKITEGHAREIRNAVHRWRGAKGGTECPTLAQLVADGEIDASSRLVDACGSSFHIRCEEDDVQVTSPGKDRVLGTEDDIRVPKNPWP